MNISQYLQPGSCIAVAVCPDNIKRLIRSCLISQHALQTTGKAFAAQSDRVRQSKMIPSAASSELIVLCLIGLASWTGLEMSELITQRGCDASSSLSQSVYFYPPSFLPPLHTHLYSHPNLFYKRLFFLVAFAPQTGTKVM